ncbi:hypothetical protein GCM10007916_20400 [Psychromonas marina]|uniref:Outer membrane protein beta-barrel domain-containing protein n=1 Tax=Psychromonas marina TaxID=88364 RepID=A0ABQ6E1E0_9GAMM|nr:porin family protein [Psychromonas marina]GLS90973.1 hypothetical protein GCM10007916_20400 [Psychromonas marina]
MKKITMKLAVITALSFSSSLLAEQIVSERSNYQGHRIGLGISSGTIGDIDGAESIDIGNGIKIEYGYDLNRIFGFNASLDKNKDDMNLYGSRYEYDLSSFKVDTDIGYAFFFDNFTVKPYGAIGLAHIKEKNTINDLSYTASENALLLGMGVRATFDFGMYVDLRTNYMILEYIDLDQLSLTVGYKF